MSDETSDDAFAEAVASAAVSGEPGEDVWPYEEGIRPSVVVQAMADGLLTEVGDMEQLALQIMLGVLQRQTVRRKEATRRAQIAEGLPSARVARPQDWLAEREVLRVEVTRLRTALERRNRESAPPPTVSSQTRAQIKAEADERVESARQAAREAWAAAAERRGCGKVPLISTQEAWLFVENICRNTGEKVSEWNVYDCKVCRWPTDKVKSGTSVWHAGHVATRAEREAAALATRTGGEPVIGFSEAAGRLGFTG